MTIATTPGERTKIAAYLELESLQALTADILLTRWRDKGLKVTGHFAADVTQACVVTLEPVETHVEGDFERRFLPAADKRGDAHARDVVVDPEGEDPAEVLGREVDLGEVLVEELSLALDPYPRKPGVEFTVEQDTVAKPDNPFAVLAKLKAKDAKTKRKP